MAHPHKEHRQDKAGRARAKEIVKEAGYAQRNSSRQDESDPSEKLDLDNLKGTED
jgi:hypothetical protein